MHRTALAHSPRSITQHILRLTFAQKGSIKIFLLSLSSRVLGSVLLLIKPIIYGTYLPLVPEPQEHKDILSVQSAQEKLLLQGYSSISAQNKLNFNPAFNPFTSLSIPSLLENFCCSISSSIPILLIKTVSFILIEGLLPSLSSSSTFSLFKSIVDQMILTRPEAIYTSLTLFGRQVEESTSSARNFTEAKDQNETALSEQLLDLAWEVSPWLKSAVGRILIQTLQLQTLSLFRKCFKSPGTGFSSTGLLVASSLAVLISEIGLTSLDLVGARWRVQMIQDARKNQKTSDESERLEPGECFTEETNLRVQAFPTLKDTSILAPQTPCTQPDSDVGFDSIHQKCSNGPEDDFFFHLMELSEMQSQRGKAVPRSAPSRDTSSLTSHTQQIERDSFCQSILLSSLSTEPSINEMEAKIESYQQSDTCSESSGKDGYMGGIRAITPRRRQASDHERIKRQDEPQISQAKIESFSFDTGEDVFLRTDSTSKMLLDDGPKEEEEIDRSTSISPHSPWTSNQTLMPVDQYDPPKISTRPSNLKAYPFSIQETLKMIVQEEGLGPFLRGVGLELTLRALEVVQ